MEDALTFLQSRPLIGIQMDGFHLNSVLQAVMRQQSECAQVIAKVERRFDHVEESIREIQIRQGEMQRTINEHMGSGQELRKLHDQVNEIESALDEMCKDVEHNKKDVVSAATDADQAGQLADTAMRNATLCQDSLRRLSSDMEGVLRQSHGEKKELTRLIDEMHRIREGDEMRLNEVIRKVEERADQLSLRARSVDELRSLLDELSDRTDDNFKSVEESARAVDAELTRQNNELSALKSDLVALETSTRNRLSSVNANTDAKIEAVASQFRMYERTARELEDHLIMAGQVLARRQTSSLDPHTSKSVGRDNYINDTINDNKNDRSYINSTKKMTRQTPRNHVTSVPSTTFITDENKSLDNNNISNNNNDRNYMHREGSSPSNRSDGSNNRNNMERNDLLTNSTALTRQSHKINR